MSDAHKVCRRCSDSLPLGQFKEVRKANGSGEYKFYRHSYCYTCEATRQKEYNAKRKPKPGVMPLEEFKAKRAKAKQERLYKIERDKEERRKQKELDRVKKEQQRKLDNERRIEEGQAKWDAWYTEWKDSGAIEEMREDARKEAEQEREARLAAGVNICSACNEELPLSQFHMRNRKRKDGTTYQSPYSHCKACRRVSNRYYENTPAGKARAKRDRAIRDRRSKEATPTWLTSEQKQQIVDIYEHMRDCRAVTGEEYHVDHIVPLRGEDICGLHVPWNLQVLPAYVNIAKSNSFWTPLCGLLEQVP